MGVWLKKITHFDPEFDFGINPANQVNVRAYSYADLSPLITRMRTFFGEVKTHKAALDTETVTRLLNGPNQSSPQVLKDIDLKAVQTWLQSIQNNNPHMKFTPEKLIQFAVTRFNESVHSYQKHYRSDEIRNIVSVYKLVMDARVTISDRVFRWTDEHGQALDMNQGITRTLNEFDLADSEDQKFWNNGPEQKILFELTAKTDIFKTAHEQYLKMFKDLSVGEGFTSVSDIAARASRNPKARLILKLAEIVGKLKKIQSLRLPTRILMQAYLDVPDRTTTLKNLLLKDLETLTIHFVKNEKNVIKAIPTYEAIDTALLHILVNLKQADAAELAEKLTQTAEAIKTEVETQQSSSKPQEQMQRLRKIFEIYHPAKPQESLNLQQARIFKIRSRDQKEISCIAFSYSAGAEKGLLILVQRDKSKKFENLEDMSGLDLDQIRILKTVVYSRWNEINQNPEKFKDSVPTYDFKNLQ